MMSVRTRWTARAGRFDGDQRGQTSLEWTLLLVAFGLPMIYVFALLLSALVGHWQLITLIHSLPFP